MNRDYFGKKANKSPAKSEYQYLLHDYDFQMVTKCKYSIIQ